jgi:drug/metabolite transporter (DMT)-like permease
LTLLELALVLGSALLHAVWSASIKQSGDPLFFNVLQLPLVVVLFAGLLPFVSLAEVPPAVWAILPATAVSHALYAYWLCRAFEHGELSLVYPIARSTPAFLPFLALPLLGERISAGGAVGIAVVVAGIWLVHGANRWTLRELAQPAARFAFLTLGATVAYSLTDKAAMSAFSAVHWSSPIPRALFFFALLSLAYGAVFVPLVLWRQRQRGSGALRREAAASWRVATLASFISLMSYTLVLRALETAKVSYAVAVRQTSVLFAVAIATWFLGERPGPSRVAGALATVVGVALIAVLS